MQKQSRESVVLRLFAYMSPKPHHTEILPGDQHLGIPSVRWPRGVNQNDYSLEYLLASLRQLVQVYAELGSGKGVRHAGSVSFSITDSSMTAFRIQFGYPG